MIRCGTPPMLIGYNYVTNFRRGTLGKGYTDVAIIEPSNTHYYQPL
jgi:hypothetical protein